jgi:hypothetical protein
MLTLCGLLYFFEGSCGMLRHLKVLDESVKTSYFFGLLNGIELMQSEGDYFEVLLSISSYLPHFEQLLVYFNGDSIIFQ